MLLQRFTNIKVLRISQSDPVSDNLRTILCLICVCVLIETNCEYLMPVFCLCCHCCVCVCADGVRCGAPLGISTGFISSVQIGTASAMVIHDIDANGIRLLRSVSPNHAWCAQHNDEQQRVLVDLEQVDKVTGVATQGRNGVNSWVRTYKIQFSNDGRNWTSYQEGGKDKVYADMYSQRRRRCLSQ